MTGIRVGPLTLANRIVFPAHLTNFAERNLPTEAHAAYYAARAAGGAGMIITEEHSVHSSDRAYPKLIQGFRPEVLPGYRRITDAVHAHGVPILAQLNHHGAQGSGRYHRQPLWAPSPVPDPIFRQVPKALTVAEIAELVAGYAEVAARCVAGGFDGVEVQAAQSSILRQFLSPRCNRRDDAYGGSLANRVRLLIEVVSAVRAAIGSDRALGVRLGLDGPADPASAWDVAGLADAEVGDLAELVAVGRLLRDGGLVDYLSTTIGVSPATQWLITPPMGVPAGYALPVARALRGEVTPLPVIGVGRFTEPAQVAKALDSGDCDLVGVARGQIADPAFASRPRQRCVGANRECVGRVGRNLRLGCLVNPLAAREASLATPVPARRSRANHSRPVLVVGGGPGGLRAAVTAAEWGHRVALYERRDRLGGALAVAARGPGRDELAHLVVDLAEQAAELGVDVRLGSAVTPKRIAELNPAAVVLATGACPHPPAWAAGVDRAVSARAVLAGRVAPEGRILVVDELGNPEAPSVAELLAGRGHRVEVVTSMLALGPDLALELTFARFQARAGELGIQQTVEREVTGVRAEHGALRVRLLHHLLGEAEDRVVDWLVYAVPPRPVAALWRALKDGRWPVHRVGDCLAPRSAADAVRDGDRVGRSL